MRQAQLEAERWSTIARHNRNRAQDHRGLHRASPSPECQERHNELRPFALCGKPADRLRDIGADPIRQRRMAEDAMEGGEISEHIV